MDLKPEGERGRERGRERERAMMVAGVPLAGMKKNGVTAVRGFTKVK